MSRRHLTRRTGPNSATSAVDSSPWKRRAAAAVLAGGLVLTGCSTGSSEPESTSTEGITGTAAPGECDVVDATLAAAEGQANLAEQDCPPIEQPTAQSTETASEPAQTELKPPLNDYPESLAQLIATESVIPAADQSHNGVESAAKAIYGLNEIILGNVEFGEGGDFFYLGDDYVGFTEDMVAPFSEWLAGVIEDGRPFQVLEDHVYGIDDTQLTGITRDNNGEPQFFLLTDITRRENENSEVRAVVRDVLEVHRVMNREQQGFKVLSMLHDFGDQTFDLITSRDGQLSGVDSEGQTNDTEQSSAQPKFEALTATKPAELALQVSELYAELVNHGRTDLVEQFFPEEMKAHVQTAAEWLADNNSQSLASSPKGEVTYIFDLDLDKSSLSGTTAILSGNLQRVHGGEVLNPQEVEMTLEPGIVVIGDEARESWVVTSAASTN